eukprot:scaffold24215_cov129-Isochrysis_galbana.AAC.4
MSLLDMSVLKTARAWTERGRAMIHASRAVSRAEQAQRRAPARCNAHLHSHADVARACWRVEAEAQGEGGTAESEHRRPRTEATSEIHFTSDGLIHN